MTEPRGDRREERIVRAYLDAVSDAGPDAPLPSAAAIWERGRVARRIERRRTLVRRAVRPVAWLERGAGFAAAAAVGTWVWWRWDLVVTASERIFAGAPQLGGWTWLGIVGSIAGFAAIAAERAAAALRRA